MIGKGFLKKIMIASLVAMFFVMPIVAHAQLTNFGGKIVFSRPCLIPPGAWSITVGLPRPGQFVYIPGVSRLYQYFQIFRIGPSVLGTAAGFSPCFPLGGGQIILQVGTSL